MKSLGTILSFLVLALLAAAPFVGLGQGWAMTLLARAMIMAMAALSLWLLVGGLMGTSMIITSGENIGIVRATGVRTPGASPTTLRTWSRWLS